MEESWRSLKSIEAGRNPDENKANLRGKIIELRKQNYSILDIGERGILDETVTY